MNALILGGTGMLGKAFMNQSYNFGYKSFSLARKNADINIDATNKNDLYAAINSVRPALIINAIAQTNLQSCEESPESAYLLNSYIPSLLSFYCSNNKNIKFCHISTDHYFHGNKDKLHDEKAVVMLPNEYSRTKYAGECFALTDPNALVLRTNIVGFRNWVNRHTFVEWVIENLTHKKPITMFNDFFTSSIDTGSCARITFQLLAKKAVGIFNVGSTESSNKEIFIRLLADKLNLDLSNASVGSVHSGSKIFRCDSLGLDVAKAEQFLGYKFPSTKEVVKLIEEEYALYKSN